MTFETTAQIPVSALKLDSLPVFIKGTPDAATRLQELLHTQCVGLMVHAGGLPIRSLGSVRNAWTSSSGFIRALRGRPSRRGSRGARRYFRHMTPHADRGILNAWWPKRRRRRSGREQGT